MFCSKCGSELPSEREACPSCGDSSHVVRIEGDPLKRPGLITLIAILDLLGGAGEFFVGAMSFAVGPRDPSSLALSSVFLLLGVLCIATGVGLLKLQPWARTAQIALSIVGLLAIPIGTVVSALFLYYLFRPGVKVLFSGRRREQLTIDDLRAIADVRGGSGVTIVIMVFVGIFLCGIISAIAIPNFLNAIDRGRQKRTVADLRAIATAVEAYADANDEYPTANTVDELRSSLQPRYLRTMPTVDGWSGPLEVRCAPDGYELRSYGKDGLRDTGSPAGASDDFDDDIVLKDGQFLQWPEGMQR